MAKSILAVSSRPSNPVSPCIAPLIDLALKERCNLSAEFHTNYYQELSTLMGLGFTAVLAEGSQVQSVRPHFSTFLRFRHFIDYPEQLAQLSYVIAELICSAIYSFKILGYPRYYNDFIVALINTLKSLDVSDVYADRRIKKILQRLFS